jgi:hypothetical protein
MSEWQDFSHKPFEPMAVLLFYGKMVWYDHKGEAAVFPLYREDAERTEVGYWDGECWCFSGTGHDVFEYSYDKDYPSEYFPTLWSALPHPPSTPTQKDTI